MSLPPYSPGTVRPSRPISPSFGHSSCGNALSWSMAAARGAISACAKRLTASRSASMSSPSGKARTPSVTADAALEARLGASQRQLQLAHHRDALLGHAVGRHVGRDAVALGDLVDAGEVVVDGAHHAHGALAVVAGDLQRHVHHAA